MTAYCTAPITYYEADGPVVADTEIGDGRAEQLSWTENGFELRTVPSSVQRWTAPDEIGPRHHPEIVELVTAEVGCDAVLFYPPIVRNPAASLQHPDLGPVEAAHSDYTEDYRPMLATPGHPYLDILAPSMWTAGVGPDDLARAERVLTLQFWRNTGPRQPDRPLALCDSRSVARRELLPYQVERYGGIPTQFFTFLVHPPADGQDRRWLTFPAMGIDEVIVFRTFDSERADRGEPFWTPHTAFVDPVAGPDAPPRASVEVRAICLFW